MLSSLISFTSIICYRVIPNRSFSMKKVFPFLLFCIFFLFQKHLFCQNSYNDSLICLEIRGIAMCNKIPLDGVNVKLFMENEEMEMTEITSVEHHEHLFRFKLQKDSYYTIEISKPGYFTRMVSISTKLPKEVSLKPIFTFEFEVEMTVQQPVKDDYYLDFPIALIDYDAKRGAFVSHGKYTSHIKGKIQESTKQETSGNGNKKK